MKDIENGQHEPTNDEEVVGESTPLLQLRSQSSTVSSKELSVASGGDDNDNNNTNDDENSFSDSSVQTIRALPGMKVRSHMIDRQGQLQLCEAKEALNNAKRVKHKMHLLSNNNHHHNNSLTTAATTANGKTNNNPSNPNGVLLSLHHHMPHYWIDIDADQRDTEELREWLGKLKLTPFLVERLSEPPETWASQVIPSKAASLAMIRILPEGHETSDEITHIAALSLPHLLVTFTSCDRSETGGLYSKALAEMQRRGRIPHKTASGALLVWLLWHIERTSRATRQLRSVILQMDAAMDQDEASVKLDEIIAAKEVLLRILSVAEEQVECLEALAGTEKDSDALDFTNLRGRLSVLQASATATERMALRMEKRLGDLRQRYEDLQHTRLNRRLAVLTVLSAIFLPLTLMTGIWGMNFEYVTSVRYC